MDLRIHSERGWRLRLHAGGHLSSGSEPWRNLRLRRLASPDQQGTRRRNGVPPLACACQCPARPCLGLFFVPSIAAGCSSYIEMAGRRFPRSQPIKEPLAVCVGTFEDNTFLSQRSWRRLSSQASWAPSERRTSCPSAIRSRCITARFSLMCEPCTRQHWKR